MRYAYVKNGDAVDQVRRVTNRNHVEASGPDAFIGDFLNAHRDDDILVLCRWRHPDQLRVGRMEAQSVPAGGVLGRLTSALQIGWRILRWKPDRLICGSTGELLWVCALVARLRRVPLVHSRHNEVQARTGLSRIADWLDVRCMRTCKGVVCHGPFLMDQVRGLDLPTQSVFEFEVDLNGFANSVRSGVPAEMLELRNRVDILLMFVGRMQYDKGIGDLLHAFNELHRKSSVHVGLIYIGDGKDLASFRDRVAGSPARENIALLGRLAHERLVAFMRATDVIVAPTRPEFPEGRCMVILESFALGVPVVGPSFGPFPFAIRHGVNGLLFAAGSKDSLQQQLTQICADSTVLAGLKRGAEEAGQELLQAHRSFARAVEQAFG